MMPTELPELICIQEANRFHELVCNNEANGFPELICNEEVSVNMYTYLLEMLDTVNLLSQVH